MQTTTTGSEILFDVSSPAGVKIADKKVIESSGPGEKSYLENWSKEHIDGNLVRFPEDTMHGSFKVREY